MVDGAKREFDIPHLPEVRLKSVVDDRANKKWEIEHANCPRQHTHIISSDKQAVTLYICIKHNDILAVKGHHGKNVPT